MIYIVYYYDFIISNTIYHEIIILPPSRCRTRPSAAALFAPAAGRPRVGHGRCRCSETNQAQETCGNMKVI